MSVKSTAEGTLLVLAASEERAVKSKQALLVTMSKNQSTFILCTLMISHSYIHVLVQYLWLIVA